MREAGILHRRGYMCEFRNINLQSSSLLELHEGAMVQSYEDTELQSLELW